MTNPFERCLPVPDQHSACRERPHQHVERGYFHYDSAGNLTSVNGGATQTYSKANRLATAAAGGVSSTYSYDAFGTRQKIKTTGSPFQVMQYDLDGNLLTETTSGAETDYAYLDGMPIAAVDRLTSTVSALHTDRIGTVEAATNSTKTLVWLCAYAPFGACTPSPASITMNLRFPGQYADPTGYYHNGFRDTYPGSNNNFYLQPDPTGLQGVSTPWSNPVIYAGMNPYRYTDPSGLDVLVITGDRRKNASTDVLGHINVAGHSAVAITGDGLYSYGTGQSLGSSVSDFLEDQVKYRDLMLTVIKTTPKQDAAAVNYLTTEHPNEMDVSKSLNNCAARTKGALAGAGITLSDPATFGITSPPSLPGNVAASAAVVAGAITIVVPQGGTVPDNFISQFEPTQGGQCRPTAQSCSVGDHP